MVFNNVVSFVIFNVKVAFLKDFFLVYGVRPQNKQTYLSFEVPLCFQRKLFFSEKNAEMDSV